MTTKTCFHCHLPIPKNFEANLAIEKTIASFCCMGCLAVTQTILDLGLDDFYHFRTEASVQSETFNQTFYQKLKLYDSDAYQQKTVITVEKQGIQYSEISLVIEGLQCAACTWLIEKRLSSVEGIESVSVNLTSHRAFITWCNNSIQLSKILTLIYKIGYKASPDLEFTQKEKQNNQKKLAQKRLGVAGLGMMQVMMLAVGLYIGNWQDMAPAQKQFIRWISCIVTTPILIYSGYPFIASALKAIKAKHLNMDVPVSVALVASYLASVILTLQHGQDVYYDSICMFIFFLTLSRYLELNTRIKLAAPFQISELLPVTCTILKNNELEIIPTAMLAPGDVAVVKPGEMIPSDGKIIDGETSVSESFLTGESCPKHKKVGDLVIGGSENIEQVIRVEISKVGAKSLLGTILHLIERSSNEKPEIIELTQKIAGIFVAAVLLLAAITLLYWAQYSLKSAFENALAVLVITCPCALSLAIPTVLTVASYTFIRHGLLVKRAYVCKGLSEITDVIFDKTGTLTMGQLSVSAFETLLKDKSYDLKRIAYTLEQDSNHPLATAIQEYCVSSRGPIPIKEIKSSVNQGIEGNYRSQKFRIGTVKFTTKEPAPEFDFLQFVEQPYCVLSINNSPAAYFIFDDQIRDSAAKTITQLKALGICTHLVTGDPSQNSYKVQRKLKIDHLLQAASPDDKVNYLYTLRQDKKSCLMVGDGINDAPVLNQAMVSISMNSGAAITKAQADAVLISNELDNILDCIKISKSAQNLIKQNLCWVIGYNVCVIPLAMKGLIAPYQAALGMSLSSLFVVVNAMRLSRKTFKVNPIG